MKVPKVAPLAWLHRASAIGLLAQGTAIYAPEASARDEPDQPVPATTQQTEGTIAAAARIHALAMLEHEALPNPEGLADAVAIVAQASVDADWKRVHAFMQERGAVLNSIRIDRARSYLQSAPPQFRTPGLESMTEEGIVAHTNEKVHVLKRPDLSKCAVTRLGPKSSLSENETLMTAPASNTPNRRRFSGERQMCFPFLYTPRDLDVDASPLRETVVLELPAENFKGEALLLAISFAYFDDCGWIPIGSLVAGAPHRPIM